MQQQQQPSFGLNTTFSQPARASLGFGDAAAPIPLPLGEQIVASAAAAAAVAATPPVVVVVAPLEVAVVATKSPVTQQPAPLSASRKRGPSDDVELEPQHAKASRVSAEAIIKPGTPAPASAPASAASSAVASPARSSTTAVTASGEHSSAKGQSDDGEDSDDFEMPSIDDVGPDSDDED
jgi:hypothetical protein